MSNPTKIPVDLSEIQAGHTRYWIDCYNKERAYWIHDGNPKRPHALLSKGGHSSGFFNSRLIIDKLEILQGAACDLFELSEMIVDGDVLSSQVGAVVGPQTGATKLAEFLSEEVGPHCFWASPAKGKDKEGRDFMRFSDEEAELVRDQPILLCEDVITTGDSLKLVENEIKRVGGGEILPYVLTLVNRSGLDRIRGKQIIALINQPMPKWSPEECPLCKQGSIAIPAKDPVNWAALNAEYP